MTRRTQIDDDIAEAERRLDRLLHNQVPDEQFVRSLQAALRQWSQAIWAGAEGMGAPIPSSSELERGLQLAQRPVFVCGPARSGTTLLRDLLDGHPELVVIPSESAFYTGMEAALMRLRADRHGRYLARYWLERLADPPPFWLLGPPGGGGLPYREFARDFAGWWQMPEQHREARIASWPLAAFALAYAQRLGAGRLPAEARMWVEKTPGAERCMERIWQDFPAAKVIHIVRRPGDVLASIKTMTARRWGRRRTFAHVLGQMVPSFRIAAASDGLEDRYCLVRYEDLTADPAAAMSRIARFLGIAPSPSLLQPTVAGRAACNNTSFHASRPDRRDVLDRVDRALLTLAIGRPAAKLGYRSAALPAATGHAIVGSLA
jgi:hypothetical protein